MSYKPPGPEEMAGPTGVGPRDREPLRRSIKIVLGITISIALLVLFLASAALAWVVLFTGPPLEVRPLTGGYVVEVAISECCADRIDRVRLSRLRDDEDVWDVEARGESMDVPLLRFSVADNPVVPDPTVDVRVRSPLDSPTFELEPGTLYMLTVWGANEAGGRGSTKASFAVEGRGGK